MLIEVKDKVVSTQLFEKKFVCDLNACKGACCIEGDSGAPSSFEEIIGKGIFAEIEGNSVKLGSSQFLKTMTENTHKKTKVHVEINGVYKGSYVFNNQYRKGLEDLFSDLAKHYNLVVLSGDNDGERRILEKMLPSKTTLVLNQKPEQKLQYIEQLQKEGKNVMMVGDGLNDAGALAQSNSGCIVTGKQFF